MFVGCSEISISFIVKHVQNIGHKSRLFVYLGRLAKFSSAWGDRKNYWVMVCLGVSVPRLTPWVCKEHKDTIAYGEKCCIRDTTEQLVIVSQSFFIWYFNWEGHMLWWEGSPMKALSFLCCVWDTHMTESILSWINIYKISVKVVFFFRLLPFIFFSDCLPNCKLRW